MDVAQLSDHIAGFARRLLRKSNNNGKRLNANLLVSVFIRKMARSSKVSAGQATGTRRKPKPKYQSKKDNLKWTGRGMTPVWMRDEMKGTNLKKDNFLIKS